MRDRAVLRSLPRVTIWDAAFVLGYSGGATNAADAR